MLGYLPSIPDPSWISGPDEPNPCGKCTHCFADVYPDAEGDVETTPCSCGTAQCCPECPRCSQCGDATCPQCAVKFTIKGGETLVCQGCHQVYLDAIEGDEEDTLPTPSRNAQVLAGTLRDILNAFSAGVRQ